MDEIDRRRVVEQVLHSAATAKNPYQFITNKLESTLASACIVHRVDYAKFLHTFFATLSPPRS